MKLLRLGMVGVLIVLVFGLAACGSDEDAGSGSEDVESGVAEAEAMVKEHMGVPEFVAPGEPLDGPAIANGKTLFIMAASNEIPYNAAFNEAVKKYAETVGFRVLEYETAGLPDQWNRGMDLAINRKVDVIALTAGLDTRAIIPAIERAKAAGIPVVSSTLGDPEDPVNAENVTAGIGLAYRLAGELMANYAIWKTDGEGKFLHVDGGVGYPSSEGVKTGVLKALEDNCPSCDLEIIEVPIPQWATEMTPKTQAALTANPDINFIIPSFDSQLFFIQPALTALAREIPVTGFNGTPEILELVQSGEVAMDVSQDIGWAGAATVDVALRILGDVEPNEGSIDQNIPLRVFDETNIDEAVEEGEIQFSAGFGDAAETGYLSLWGVQ